MRQRHHVGGADREQRVEEVGEPDAARLADEPEQRAVGGEGPGGAADVDSEAWFVNPIEELLAGTPGITSRRAMGPPWQRSASAGPAARPTHQPYHGGRTARGES